MYIHDIRSLGPVSLIGIDEIIIYPKTLELQDTAVLYGVPSERHPPVKSSDTYVVWYRYIRVYTWGEAKDHRNQD